MGLLKSGMGIGGLLLEGIGDTIRVSLAADPEKEVEAGFNILRAVGYAVAGPEVITCPTCGRTQYPCIEIANEVGAPAAGLQKAHQGGGDGMCGQRSRRGPGGGHRHCRRQKRGGAVRPWPAGAQADGGQHPGPVHGGDLQAMRENATPCTFAPASPADLEALLPLLPPGCSPARLPLERGLPRSGHPGGGPGRRAGCSAPKTLMAR